ncbi:MAG: hypothetical protein E7299_05305 [Lachnospiraceae bacterium]|nr:hypothetical protein [Lachnospiraceae bacterium]
MHYEIYVDQLILLDFIVNTYLLYLVKVALETRVDLKKIMKYSLGNATLFTGIMLLPGIPFFVKLFLQIFICNGLLIRWLFKEQTQFMRRKAYVIMHGYGLLLGGSILIFHRVIGMATGRYMEMWMEMLLFATVYFVLFKRYLMHERRQRKIRQYTYQVKLDLYGEVYRCIGLYDSGNSLYEPCTGRPVVLIERRCIENYLERIPEEKTYVIPYHSIGKSRGLLEAIEVPIMILETANERYIHEKVIVALSTQYLSKYYQAILHPRFFDAAEQSKEKEKV